MNMQSPLTDPPNMQSFGPETYTSEIEFMALDSIVRADAAHIAHLVLEGLTTEADEYAVRREVASRIRRWKEARA